MANHLTLPNGVTVSLYPDETTTGVGLAAAVRGSRYEPRHVTGMLHLVEHLLGFENRQHTTRQKFAVALDRWTPDLMLLTGKETLTASFETEADQVVKSLHGLADLLLNARIVQTSVKDQREIIEEEERGLVDNPTDHLDEVMEQLVFSGHVLARSIWGSVDKRQSFSAAEVRDWLNVLIRDRLQLCIVGNFSPADLSQPLQQQFGRLMMRPTMTSAPFRVTQSRPRLRLIHWPAGSIHIGLGFPAPFGFHHPDRLAFSVLNNHLGASYRNSSRLRLRLVLDQPNLYWAWSSIWNYRETGLLVTMTSCLPHKVFHVLQKQGEEFRRLRDQELTAEEINEAILSLSRQARKKWRDPAMRAAFLVEQALVAGETKTCDQYERAVRRHVTAKRIQHVARNIFRPDRMNVVIIGPGVTALDRRKILQALRA